MLVVPVKNDKITTHDGKLYRVLSYNSFKDAGPAVFARTIKQDEADSHHVVLVYFFDIEKINGVTVELVPGSKVFRALGLIKRSQHLPQPDDNVTAEVSDINTEETDTKFLEVKALKLKSKTLGHARGMHVIGTDDEIIRLKHVKNIKRALTDVTFNHDEFVKLYKDYFGA